MSVTAAGGFRAAGVAAGLKSNGSADVAVVVNDGPRFDAAGVFTTNKVVAAPVIWSRQVLTDRTLRAVVLNSGGANACTGPQGFADTHRTAERVAEQLDIGAIDVAVCSTGLIGVPLDMPALLAGVDRAIEDLSGDGGLAASEAIITTDSQAKRAQHTLDGATVGGMAKGAGMLAPGMATMLAVLTTDAVIDSDVLHQVLTDAVDRTFNRVDSDGCMSTNDTVLLLASGASGVTWDRQAASRAVLDVCDQLARAMVADAEGASKEIRIDVDGARTESEAVSAARAVARSNLFKAAMFGCDPNWGRILAAVGTSAAHFEPDQISVQINGITVCRDGAAFGDPDTVDLSGRHVHVGINLGAGSDSGFVWTNDLTHDYVHENSAYST
jgi:glutamate N-acetyltransferase / amino-acid N-acetyltransferase